MNHPDRECWIYHLVVESEFRAGISGSVYTPARLAEDGFVHGAFEAFVLCVADDYFAGVTGPLILLELDPSRIGAPVRYEAAAPIAGGGTRHLETGSLFPHVYGPIDLAAIRRVGVAIRGDSGYRWPTGFQSLARWRRLGS
jgi:uncharacterized protein (DUF952 family)